MCPFEKWLGFCPFFALGRFCSKVGLKQAGEVWAPVSWEGPRGSR